MRILLTLILLTFCSCTQSTQAFSPPPKIEGGWTLAASNSNDAPEWMGRLGLKQALRLQYSGPIDAVADIFEFNADTSAFESTQRWRKVNGEDQFYKRNLFVVIRSSHPNREMMMDFSRSLQKSL